MKIKSLTVKNVKSFKEETKIDFDGDINILVGPNGGGKSNLLDIITVVLRHYFLISYKVQRDQFGRQIRVERGFNNPGMLNSELSKFLGDNSNSYIEICFNVTKEDINVIKSIQENFDKIIKATYKFNDIYPRFDLEFIKDLDPTIFKPGEITYKIKNNEDIDFSSLNHKEVLFLNYLRCSELFSILSKETEGFNLNSNYMQFSPYREGGQSYQINLSEEYYNQLGNYLNATSKNVTSLIRLTASYFIQKKLSLMDNAKEEGYGKKWENDPEIKIINDYLKRLGYSWDLKFNFGMYEIFLKKGQREFRIDQASTGEKEIINFLFGIFAFNIKNGIIVIDEPELHLHPKWQSVLVDLFITLSEQTGNQFVLSTHSAIFINNKTIPNVMRLYFGKTSNITKIKKENLDNTKDLLHMINSHNNEKVFFADKVVLVEGIHDRLIFEKLIDHFNTENIEVIEVLEVHGKQNLQKYRDFLNNMEVNNFIIADFDYLKTIGDPFIKGLFETSYKRIDKEVIKKKKSIDGNNLALELENAIETTDMDKLEEIWGHIKIRNTKIKDGLKATERRQIDLFIDNKKSDRIFVLKKGEIEDYLPDGFKKLENTIKLIKDQKFNDWWKKNKNTVYVKEMKSIILDIINA